MGWLRVTHKALIGGFALRSQRLEHCRVYHFLKFDRYSPKAKCFRILVCVARAQPSFLPVF